MSSAMRRSLRPALAALSVAVPLANRPQPTRCNTAAPGEFVGNVAFQDAIVLKAKFERQMSETATVDDSLAHMWTELVNWCRRRQREKKLPQADAMEFEIPVDWIRSLKAGREGLAWLRPVMKWVEDPDVMRLIDLDGNNMMSFKEFSVLLLLALTQSQGDAAPVVTKKGFIRSMYALMDLDNDGTIVMEEFVSICSLLAGLGMIDADQVGNECRKRGLKDSRKAMFMVESKDFQSAFENAFYLYDEDGDRNVSLDEWSLFASEWLGWNLERGLK